jgi:hypothetical protein
MLSLLSEGLYMDSCADVDCGHHGCKIVIVVAKGLA